MARAIRSPQALNVGQINQTLLSDNSPYLYVVQGGVAGNTVYVDARRRTASEAGLIPVEASAYDAVYGALGSNEALRNLFLSQTSRDGFIDAYEQMLPDHSGGPLMSLSAGVDAVTRALTGRNAAAPQFTDHYFTGDYPTRLLDREIEEGGRDAKGGQLSLLVTA